MRVGNDGEDRETQSEKVSYREVIKRGWTYFLVGYLNYGTTLCVFPALTALGKHTAVLRSSRVMALRSS